MPNFRSGNFKQKNKKFKGSNKQSSEFKENPKTGERVSKKIQKASKKAPQKSVKGQTKANRRNENNKKTRSNDLKNYRKIVEQSTTLDASEKAVILQSLATLKTPKIVVVFALNQTNQDKLVAEIAANFASNFEQKNATSLIFQLTFGSDKFAALKSLDSFTIVNCPRDLGLFLNYLKVADVVITVSTLLHADTANLNKMPEDSIRIIDDIGNQAISLMRAQGQPHVISVITDIGQLDKSKHKDARFYSKRLIEEEFWKETSCHIIDKKEDIIKVLLDLQKRKPIQFNWRSERGYFMADQIEVSDSQTGKVLKIGGYLKNTWGPNNAAHLTGFGDFQQFQVEGSIVVKGKPVARFVKVTQSPDDFRIFNDKATEMTIESEPQMENEEEEDEIDEFEELKRDFQQLKITEKDEGVAINTNELQSEDGDYLSADELNATFLDNKTLMRPTDQREFEDELEYGANVNLSQRLSKYKFLSSFATSTWNKYVISKGLTA